MLLTLQFGGPSRVRTGDWGLQSHCVPNYTNSPWFGDSWWNRTTAKSFGDFRTATILTSHITLLPMCVPKHTLRTCFGTLGFFYVQEHKPSPRPPICSFECCRLALPCTLITIIERYRESTSNTLLLSSQFSLKKKTPEFLIPGSLN